MQRSLLNVLILPLFLLLLCQREWDNPYENVDYNTEPQGRIHLSHIQGTIDTLFIASAFGSYDAEDSLTDLQFRWDWESDGTWDADWSSALVDTHMFAQGGVKAVKMVVKDRGGMMDTVIVTLGINAAPTARFTVTPHLCAFEYSVVVDAGASEDLEDDSSLFEYRWNFGNGEGWSSWLIIDTVTYTYIISDKNSIHAKVLKLEVRDTGGAVGSAETTITVDFHPGMKSIPAGQFTMGSNFENDSSNSQVGGGLFTAEMVVHNVQVSSFWIDSVEVTQGAYEALMGANPAAFGMAQNNKMYPVERVSWYMAILYCNARSKQEGLDTVYSYTAKTSYTVSGMTTDFYRLENVVIQYNVVGYRLPTEAEWEYACRAGSDGYYVENTKDHLATYMWFNENSGGMTHSVAQKTPNAFGLYDMLGNVSEWCNDWFVVPYDVTGSLLNPVGPSSEPLVPVKVLRGEHFNGYPPFMRPSYRYSFMPDGVNGTSSDIGFRIVLSVQ